MHVHEQHLRGYEGCEGGEGYEGYEGYGIWICGSWWVRDVTCYFRGADHISNTDKMAEIVSCIPHSAQSR